MQVVSSVRCFVLTLCILTCLRSHANDDITTRIVSLVPGLTETCFATGAGEQLVGVSDFCDYPGEAKTRPRVGGLGRPRLEQILQLRPTHVLLYRSDADFAEKLRQLKVEPRLFNLDRIADVYAATTQLGELTGHVSAAQQLIDATRKQLADVQSQTSGSAIAAVVVVGRDAGELKNLYQAGPENFLGELLEIAGGRVSIPSGAAITAEKLILANPEVIIDMTEGEAGSAGKPEHRPDAWRQLSTVKAVKSGRVYYLNDPHALVPGPYLPHVAQTFHALLTSGTVEAK